MSNVINLQIYVCIYLFIRKWPIEYKRMQHVPYLYFKTVAALQAGAKTSKSLKQMCPSISLEPVWKPVHSADFINEHIHTPRGHTNTPVYPRQVHEHTLLKACPCSTLGTFTVSEHREVPSSVQLWWSEHMGHLGLSEEETSVRRQTIRILCTHAKYYLYPINHSLKRVTNHKHIFFLIRCELQSFGDVS